MTISFLVSKKDKKEIPPRYPESTSIISLSLSFILIKISATAVWGQSMLDRQLTCKPATMYLCTTIKLAKTEAPF